MNISSMYLFAYEVGLLQVKVPLVAMKAGVDLQKYVDVLLPSAPATIKMVQVLRSFSPLNISLSCTIKHLRAMLHIDNWVSHQDLIFPREMAQFTS